jgi:hypothetical protein
MKLAWIKFLVPVCVVLVLIGAGINILNTSSVAHAASSSCGWSPIDDEWVAPGLGTHIAESQMYVSTCNGALYCRLINHSSSYSMLASIGIIREQGGGTSLAATIAPRAYANGPQINGSGSYLCSGEIASYGNTSVEYFYTTVNAVTK